MNEITIFKKENLVKAFKDGYSEEAILAETCSEVSLRLCTLKSGSTKELEVYSADDKMQILAFTEGTGYLQYGKKLYCIEEPGVFIPDFAEESIVLQAGEQDLEFIRIVGIMNDTDRRQMRNCQYVLPRYVKFRDSIQYTERFTQESGAKVKQHSIIAGRHLGRYTMGWVIGEGPDFVGQHIHPSLEQWYFMLKNADFTYDAGDTSIKVSEGDVSFTPHGTSHGSTCKEDGFINYLWFELNRAWDEI